MRAQTMSDLNILFNYLLRDTRQVTGISDVCHMALSFFYYLLDENHSNLRKFRLNEKSQSLNLCDRFLDFINLI